MVTFLASECCCQRHTCVNNLPRVITQTQDLLTVWFVHFENVDISRSWKTGEKFQYFTRTFKFRHENKNNEQTEQTPQQHNTSHMIQLVIIYTLTQKYYRQHFQAVLKKRFNILSLTEITFTISPRNRCNTELHCYDLVGTTIVYICTSDILPQMNLIKHENFINWNTTVLLPNKQLLQTVIYKGLLGTYSYTVNDFVKDFTVYRS